jgi:hypothetical protein
MSPKQSNISSKVMGHSSNTGYMLRNFLDKAGPLPRMVALTVRQ